MKGLVLKGIGGFYFVETEKGVYRSKARGIFKKNKNILMVGDEVELEIPQNVEDDAWISDIAERKNYFLRPPISNVDKLIIVFAATSPDPNYVVIDKMLMMAEQKGIEAVICINKIDLVEEEKLTKIKNIYENVYPTILTNAMQREGVSEIESIIGSNKVAFAGPSGVGKSTLVNCLVPGEKMETGDISSKTSRGKHTTRHVEILKLGDGFVFDTPGFTSLDLDPDISEDKVGDLFPEIRRVSRSCKFNDCMHINEPDCAVRVELENGKISKVRYNTYLETVKELRERRKRYE